MPNGQRTPCRGPWRLSSNESETTFVLPAVRPVAAIRRRSVRTAAPDHGRPRVGPSMMQNV
jgi:hypothetical protein